MADGKELQSGLNAQPFSLAGWVVDPRDNSLRRGATQVELTPMAMQVLLLLARHAGEVVRRETLIDAVWEGNYFSGPKRLNDEIWRLRQALDVDGRAHSLIRTLPRRGYMLVDHPRPLRDGLPEAERAEHTGNDETSTPRPADGVPGRPASRQRNLWWWASSLALALCVGWLVGAQSRIGGPFANDATQSAQVEQEMADFVAGLLSASPSPEGDLSGPMAAEGEMLARVIERGEGLLTAYSGTPGVRARLTVALSRVAFELGHLADARRLAEQAVALSPSHGDGSIDASAKMQLGTVLRFQGQGAESERLYAEVMARIESDPTSRANPLLRAAVLEGLGLAKGIQRDFVSAERYLREVVRIRRQSRGEQDLGFVRATLALGVIRIQQDRDSAEALDLLRYAIEQLEQHPNAGDPRLGRALSLAGIVLGYNGHVGEALPLVERAVRTLSSTLGVGNAHTLNAMMNLAMLRLRHGDTVAAQETLSMVEAQLLASREADNELLRGRLREFQRDVRRGMVVEPPRAPEDVP